jgi:hypothetical protein
MTELVTISRKDIPAVTGVALNIVEGQYVWGTASANLQERLCNGTDWDGVFAQKLAATGSVTYADTNNKDGSKSHWSEKEFAAREAVDFVAEDFVVIPTRTIAEARAVKKAMYDTGLVLAGL